MMPNDLFETIYKLSLIGTFGTLVWYTVETFRLRKEAQEANESKLTPVPTIIFNATKFQTKLLDADFDIDEKDILIANIGNAAAVNVKFSTINLPPDGTEQVQFRMEHSTILLPNESHLLAVTQPNSRTRWGKVRGGHPHPYLIPGMVVDEETGIRYDLPPEGTHWATHTYKFSITYENPYGKKFKAFFEVDKTGAHLLALNRGRYKEI